MSKHFYSLGLMSGTSMDGVDASIIQSDGETNYNAILNKYFKYNNSIYQNLSKLRDKIKDSGSLKEFSKELKLLEKKITLFHANVVKKVTRNTKVKVDFIGFHGQTIFHSAKEKISKQLGDGKLLSKLTKKTVIYNFRKNDLINGGQGAPLTPIFHKLLVDQHKIDLPVCILNLGGIANVTAIIKINDNGYYSHDLGPGNCLIDEWVRKNTKKKYDKNGSIAKSGNVKKDVLNKAIKSYFKYNKKKYLSLDIKDFDLSFANELSLKNGAATLTEFTANIIGSKISNIIKKKNNKNWKILVSGGGRKNKMLMRGIRKIIIKNSTIKPIDDFNIHGDFVESQAFAYLAIRSYLKLPISFPRTTGVKKPSIGGIIIKSKQ